MKRLWGLWLWGVVAAGLHAEEPGALFQKANRAYQAGDFTAAREGYEAVVQRGGGGVALDYNLGNAYFRLNQMGRARLWYERALAASPTDEDVLYNRNLIQKRIGETPEGTDGLGRFAGLLWALTAGANLVFFGLLTLGLFHRGEALWWGRWGAGILLAFLVTAALAAQRQAALRYGVVLSPRAEARAGPAPEEPVGFTLPEGHRVVLLDDINDWVQVGLPAQGLKGWIPRAAIEPI